MVIGPGQPLVPVGEADGDAGAADGARPAPALGEVGEVELEGARRRGPRGQARAFTPARERVPVVLVGFLGARGMGGLHVVLGARRERFGDGREGVARAHDQRTRKRGGHGRAPRVGARPERELHGPSLSLNVKSVKAGA